MKNLFKPIISILLVVITMLSAMSGQACIVPRDALPDNTPQEAVDVAEGYIKDTLAKVQNGLGYADAKGETNRILFNAFLSNQTNGYSYGLLTIIANNALFEYRDMYLRPDVYVAYEAQVKILLANLITAVENGSMTYNDAKKEAYTLIYKSVDPSFDPQDRFLVDFCYWDIIDVDAAMFNRARKVLLEAEDNYKASLTSLC